MGLDVASIKLLTQDIVKAVLVLTLYGRNIPILTGIIKGKLLTVSVGNYVQIAKPSRIISLGYYISIVDSMNLIVGHS